MQQREENEFNAFLKARLHLPNADFYDRPLFAVCVGLGKTSIRCDVHIRQKIRLRTFMFFKQPIKDGYRAFRWVCTNPKLQQMIDEMDTYAEQTLRNIGR